MSLATDFGALAEEVGKGMISTLMVAKTLNASTVR
jgi:hypothetical protein